MSKRFSHQEERDLRFVFQLFQGGGNDGVLGLEDLRRALARLGFKPDFKNLRQMALDVELSQQAANTRGATAGTSTKSNSDGGPRTDIQGFLHIVASLQDTGYDHYAELTQASHTPYQTCLVCRGCLIMPNRPTS